MNRRKSSNRLQGYDYTLPGAYFVTLVSKQREPIFGELVGENVLLSTFGQIVAEEWAHTAELRPEITLDAFVVMPNHFHAILFLAQEKSGPARPITQPTLGAHRGAPLRLHREPGSLGSVVAGFKSKASQRAGIGLWQRNYYDRIIRDQVELEQIREYVLYNPLLLSQKFRGK